MSFLDDLIGTGATVAGIESQKKALETLGTGAVTGAATIGQNAITQSAFKPYAVTTSLGSTQTDAQGGFTSTLSPEQLAMQQQIMQSAGTGATALNQPLDPAYGQFAQQAFTGANTGIGSVYNQDPNMQMQRQQLQGLFGQQMGQYGQPTGLEGLTSNALQQGQNLTAQGMSQPTDLNMLRGQFAGQVGGMLNQQPSSQFNNLAQYGSSAGLSGLQGAGNAGTGMNNLGLDFLNQSQGMLGQSFGSPQMQQMGQQAYTGAANQFNQGAPSDIEALRAQSAGMANQANQAFAGTDRAGREQQIYDQMRGMQRPEEERQRLALEERLFAQGRGGVQTAQYGGTPEQLAMAKAQAEAQNQAGMMSMQQAGSEQDRALQQAMSLTGQTGQLAGMSSDLQNASQQRGAQLAQLGMSSDQIQSQLQSEGLGRATQAAGMGANLQGQSEALKGQAQQRAAQLSQMGMSAEQVQSQLQSEGLNRAGTAAGMASQLAGTASGLQSEALNRGMGLSQLGMQGAQQQQQMGAQQLQQLMGLQQSDQSAAGAQQALQQGNLGLASGMMQAGQQARMNPQQLQQAQIQNLLSSLQAGYAPENQMLNNFQAGSNSAALADMARRQGAQYSAEADMSGLQAKLQAGLKSADLTGQYYGAAANLAGSKNEQNMGMIQQVLGATGLGANLPDWLQKLAGIGA